MALLVSDGRQLLTLWDRKDLGRDGRKFNASVEVSWSPLCGVNCEAAWITMDDLSTENIDFKLKLATMTGQVLFRRT
jgi:hypothetical protein